jgi:hypothetical protein
MDNSMAQVLRDLADGLELVARAVRRMGDVSAEASEATASIPESGVCGAICKDAK